MLFKMNAVNLIDAILTAEAPMYILYAPFCFNHNVNITQKSNYYNKICYYKWGMLLL